MKEWSVTPETFRRQMAYLHKKGYQSITLEQLWRYLTEGTPLPAHPICLTFDDGYRNNLTYGFPILAQYGFSATVFLVSGFIGGVNEWDKIDPRPALLSWEEILANQNPYLSFQSHSLSHRNLTKLSLEEAGKEVGLSSQIISQRLAKPVDFFAYPYGKFNAGVKTLVVTHKYKAAFSVYPGLCRPEDDLFCLKRIEIFYSDSMLDFFLKLKTGYNWRGWLKKIYRNTFKQRGLRP
jgi:peptidoglycan/xylan/chitin deacetylase (PgdA/CDA1 family)